MSHPLDTTFLHLQRRRIQDSGSRQREVFKPVGNHANVVVTDCGGGPLQQALDVYFAKQALVSPSVSKFVPVLPYTFAPALSTQPKIRATRPVRSVFPTRSKRGVGKAVRSNALMISQPIQLRSFEEQRQQRQQHQHHQHQRQHHQRQQQRRHKELRSDLRSSHGLNLLW